MTNQAAAKDQILKHQKTIKKVFFAIQYSNNLPPILDPKSVLPTLKVKGLY